MSRYYNSHFDDFDGLYLEHFGVKGMKWKNHVYKIKNNLQAFRDKLKYSRPGDYKINSKANKAGHAYLQKALKNGGAQQIKDDNYNLQIKKRVKRLDKNTFNRINGSEGKKYEDSFNKDVKKGTNKDIKDLIDHTNKASNNAAAMARALRKKDIKAAVRLSNLKNFYKKQAKKYRY